MGKVKIEILCSIMNFFDSSLPQALFSPISTLTRVASLSSYDGLQIYPLRLPLAGMQLFLGLLNEEEKKAIKSLHASFRGEKNLAEVFAHPLWPMALATYIMMPYKGDIKYFQRLQQKIGRKLPVCFYHDRPVRNESFDGFQQELVQPYPEMMRFLGATTPNELVSICKRKLFNGFTLNLTALRYQGEPTLAPTDQVLETLLPYSPEIHISCWTTSPLLGNIDLQEELKDLFSRSNKTQIWSLLERIKDLCWPECLKSEGSARIIIKIPPKKILWLLRGREARFMTFNHWSQAHLNILSHLKALFK